MKGLQFVFEKLFLLCGYVLQVVRNVCVAEYVSLCLYAMYKY